MGRTGQQRLDAIQPSLARREEFYARVTAAESDVMKCADLMAEAIQMKFEANGTESVGRDGRKTVAIEEVVSAHCMLKARDAYLIDTSYQVDVSKWPEIRDGIERLLRVLPETMPVPNGDR